jgi:hypothetical protein
MARLLTLAVITVLVRIWESRYAIRCSRGKRRGLPMDYDELERWTRIGFERGMRSRKGER